MKSFNIIRYLKKWWPLIALMSFCAGVFFMRYATSNQSYTAQSIIKYNYSKAEDGKTPSGEDLDVSEIFSSTVVKEAIENLGLTVNVDTIRSGGTVTGIVPDDVTKTQEAKIDKGEDVEEYHSTEYIVKLSVSSEYSTEYVRTMLDEILSCYFANFGEKYVDYSTIPNNAAALDGQGYDYIEQAEILAIVDHHRLADIQTRQPINVRNEPVGSTNTIITSMYQEHGVTPSPHMAGLMAAAILSDTVMFKSPTCTKRDIAMAERLARIAKVSLSDLGRELFSGSNDSRSAEELLRSDFKEFHISEQVLGVGQVTCIDSQKLMERKDELLEAMRAVQKSNSYDMVILMLTDVLQEGSQLLYIGSDETIRNAFAVEPKDNMVFLPGVMSRKKQVIPMLTTLWG